jgi:hypothetical protein
LASLRLGKAFVTDELVWHSLSYITTMTCRKTVLFRYVAFYIGQFWVELVGFFNRMVDLRVRMPPPVTNFGGLSVFLTVI